MTPEETAAYQKEIRYWKMGNARAEDILSDYEDLINKALQPTKHHVTCSCGKVFTTDQKMTMDVSDKLDLMIERLEEILSDG